MKITDNSVISRITLLSFLGNIKSGLGLDVSKNHTGVFIWNGVSTEEYGFAIDEYDETDYFAEYKMRREFKKKLSEIVRGREFEVCIVEDCYGGLNFSTVRKLLALQTVIDELIFEYVVFVDEFYRWNEPKWMKSARMVYKQKGKWNAKLETQMILEYLGYSFYLEHKDDEKEVKEDIFFEDICDACGMLVGVVAHKVFQTNLVKQESLKMSDVKMAYIEFTEDTYSLRDSVMREEAYMMVDLDTRNLEKSILMNVRMHPDDLMCAHVPSSKLGVFGVQHNFMFYEENPDWDTGYLLFYKRRRKSG